MDKTYVKIFAALLAFGGVAALFWGGWWLSVTPASFSLPYSYDVYGRMLYMDVDNPAYTMGYYIILLSIGQLILARWVHGLSKG